jgi:hypothetical protein
LTGRNEAADQNSRTDRNAHGVFRTVTVINMNAAGLIVIRVAPYPIVRDQLTRPNIQYLLKKAMSFQGVTAQ